MEIGRYSPPDAALKWSEDGAGLDYNRPPRLRPPERKTHFRLPTPPRDRETRPLPWLMAIFPLVSAIVMAVIFGRWYYLIMAVMSPLMLVGNYFNDKKQGRKSHAKQVKEYREHKARIDNEAQEALAAERLERRRSHPDPATVLSLSTGPRTRLWERRRTDRDHLLLRVGTGRLPSEVVLDDPEQDDHRREVTWQIEDAPVTLPLASLGVIGMAGPGDSARALARWAVAQAAVLHSPVDVQFYVLTEGTAQESWDWVRWLPHSRPSGGHDTNVLIGTDAETVGARIGELTQLLDARRKAAKENGNKGAAFSEPDIVVLWDGSRRLRSMPGVVRLLREGPSVAMYALCLDSEDRFLPGECQAIVVAEPRPEDLTAPKQYPRQPTPRQRAVSPPSRPGILPRPGSWSQHRVLRSCGCGSSRPTRRASSTYAPTSYPPPGVCDLPARCRPSAISAVRPRTRRCPAPADCSMSSNWSRPPAKRSPGAGAWADSQRWRSSGSRTTAPSASTSVVTDHTASSPARPAPVSRSCCRRSSPHSRWPIGRGHDVRAGRLQGRFGIQGLCELPHTVGHGHRPRRTPGRTRPGVVGRRTETP